MSFTNGRPCSYLVVVALLCKTTFEIVLERLLIIFKDGQFRGLRSGIFWKAVGGGTLFIVDELDSGSGVL